MESLLKLIAPIKFSSEIVCGSKQYAAFLGLEFGAKTIPAVLFFILGMIRFCKIKDYGQGRTRYSVFFKSKCIICLSLTILNFFSIFLVFVMPDSLDNGIWVSKCGQEYWTFFYALQGLSWAFAVWLMIFEYQRLLSEAWYANQLFWSLNLLLEVIDFAVLFDNYVSSPVMLVGVMIYMIALTTLVVLMFCTETRTLQNMRPQVENEEILLHSDQRSMSKTSSIVSGSSGPFIFVRFQEKCI